MSIQFNGNPDLGKRGRMRFSSCLVCKADSSHVSLYSFNGRYRILCDRCMAHTAWSTAGWSQENAIDWAITEWAGVEPFGGAPVPGRC